MTIASTGVREPAAWDVGACRSPSPDLGLVAQIVRIAGVPCALDVAPGATTIWAEPRHRDGRAIGWTVRVRQRRDTGEVTMGPADGDGPGLRIAAGCDERELAAIVVAQSLRVDPLRPLTDGEAGAAGLPGWVPVSRTTAAPVDRRP